MTIYVGVMSGTSLDGLDVAVVDLEGSDERPTHFEVIGFSTASYSPSFRERIRALIDEGTTADVCGFDFDLGQRIGEAVEDALAQAGVPASDVAAIGSHGQTIWHIPPENGGVGATLQVGNASVIAEVAGATVVSDFRTRDMAAGGHGAPLTAYVDHLLFSGSEARLIQNIGGMANVTVLPSIGSPDIPVAFDTGPGMALIDGAVRELTGAPYDEGGQIAEQGTVSEIALEEWLEDPFFDEAPPKSTGRERFSTARLQSWLERHSGLSDADRIATLTELTARSIADAHRGLSAYGAPCFACGGGARNPTLLARIRELVRPAEVRDLSELGVNPDAREAIGFAVLARQHMLGTPANAPWATGASGRRVLGSRSPA